MSTRNRIPALLEPYLQIPPELSLIVLTGTLGCTPHWLTSLFIGHVLSPRGEDGKDRKVVLASWMRDAEFWRTLVKRTTSLDISKLEQQGRCTFIDCLSTASASRASNPLTEARNRIEAELSATPENRETIIVLDAPDTLLALGAATAQQLTAMLMHLRLAAHAALVSCSADAPLVSAAIASTDEGTALPVELETASFLVQMGHGARLIMSVRELQSGAAKDVSGVLRITRAADVYRYDDDETFDGGGARDLEALYLVQRDGLVKVFARGEGVS